MHLDPKDHNGSTLDKDKYDRSVNSRIQTRSMDTKYITSAEYIHMYKVQVSQLSEGCGIMLIEFYYPYCSCLEPGRLSACFRDFWSLCGRLRGPGESKCNGEER